MKFEGGWSTASLPRFFFFVCAHVYIHTYTCVYSLSHTKTYVLHARKRMCKRQRQHSHLVIISSVIIELEECTPTDTPILPITQHPHTFTDLHTHRHGHRHRHRHRQTRTRTRTRTQTQTTVILSLTHTHTHTHTHTPCSPFCGQLLEYGPVV